MGKVGGSPAKGWSPLKDDVNKAVLAHSTKLLGKLYLISFFHEQGNKIAYVKSLREEYENGLISDISIIAFEQIISSNGEVMK